VTPCKLDHGPDAAIPEFLCRVCHPTRGDKTRELAELQGRDEPGAQERIAQIMRELLP